MRAWEQSWLQPGVSSQILQQLTASYAESGKHLRAQLSTSTAAVEVSFPTASGVSGARRSQTRRGSSRRIPNVLSERKVGVTVILERLRSLGAGLKIGSTMVNKYVLLCWCESDGEKEKSVIQNVPTCITAVVPLDPCL